MKKKLLLAFPLLIAAVALVVLAVQASSPNRSVVTGTVEMHEIDVASEVPGRVDSLFVDEGQTIRKGDVIARLDSKEIDAKVQQAMGAMEAATAKYDMAKSGARKEEKEQAKMLFLQAQHQFELAEKTYNRIQKVYQDSIVSEQERDQVEFQFHSAQEQLNAAKAKYDMALNGARKEEIAGAAALLRQAEGAYREARAFQDETKIVSPADGEVSKKIVHAGEIAAAGGPVVSITDLSDTWVVLQLREDQMKSVKMNKIVSAKIPALGDDNNDFIVSYISPMADFATWRATNEKGDFDVKTFEVHLKPVRTIPGLRAGMTVHAEL